MVLIEVKDESTTFLCTACKRKITTGEDFLVSREDLPEKRMTSSEKGIHYNCVCGSRFELIKSSNPLSKDRLKFKHVRVVETGYAV